MTALDTLEEAIGHNEQLRTRVLSLAKLVDSGSYQSYEVSGLKTATYPKEWEGLSMRVFFGMGAPARIPWIGFVPPEMHIRKGFYPVYLYYKDLGELILAYGISETEETEETWPAEVINSTTTIEAHFDRDVPRYGGSSVFRSYKVAVDGGVKITYTETSIDASDKDLEADLRTLLDYYKKIIAHPITPAQSREPGQGIFYMEKQLEDFIIRNWESTELGKKLDLIIEEGELLSQQYRTEIGPIDILAKDKVTKGYVVIELKKDQTSDDTVGQVARYMGWIKKAMNTDDVKGIIIAGQYDKKLDYALGAVPNVEVFLYEVNFKLGKFAS